MTRRAGRCAWIRRRCAAIPASTPPPIGASTARPGQRFEGEVKIAARGVAPDAMIRHYNGKIDRPRIAKRALERDEMSALGELEPPAALAAAIVGFWDFARETPSARIVDLSEGGHDGVLVNLPVRAMTGFNWSGDVGDWRFAPEQYGAIHFHDDDVYDVGWETDFRFDSDPGMQSGVYAARLTIPGAPPEHVVFFVRPPLGARRSDVCYLAPTASYLRLRQLPGDGLRSRLRGLSGPHSGCGPGRPFPQRASRVRRLAVRRAQRRQRHLLQLAPAANR